ncbi:MAG TPA: thioesterase family protein [Pseudomonas xinjiangensis]|uniref:Thioesterase family protein n=2 Tax=root TaxID=1 RepID=A0A7V1FT16_9GAMM|nr:thioesterase family protein [Halopseudomonas xinjiangensis]HEC49365.1 thioesterase family protein [Halopseudomonas xinjiangensis]
MTFAELLADLSSSSTNEVTVPASWAQGRAGYGGLVAALVYEGMRAKVLEGRPVRSLAITFVGPVAPGEPMQVEAQVLREGKAVTQMFGKATQNGQVMCIIQGSFGASRESEVKVPAEPAPQARPPHDCVEMPYIEGLNPVFIKNFSVRWAFGDLPFTNSSKREMGGWMSFRNDEGTIAEAHILGLVDVWPPAVLPHLKQRAPASSLTWTIEFVQPQPAVGNTDYLLYRAEIEHARDGYGHASAMVWTERGDLVAISRQTVTVFG